LPILDPFDRQFLELGRVCLFRYLHFLPSKSDANSRSPLADEISGEAQKTFYSLRPFRSKADRNQPSLF
ncbi:MAG: hypothetical protein Q8Q80_19045, partial [Methyloversatilis sp.]|uniref:hypothetical protein n=1 Tax=Methyloversatilis sp. TaxID=2569862 RepID=UPI002735C388